MWQDMFAETGKGCIGLDQVMDEMGRLGELAANIQPIDNDPEPVQAWRPKHWRAGDLGQAQHRGDHGAFSVVGKRRF